MKDGKWLGWCKNPSDNSDKVWGIILLKPLTPYSWRETQYVTFWGRRGKRLQTKIVELVEFDVDKLIISKTKKGYINIPNSDLSTVYPEFEDDLSFVHVEARLSV